MKTLIIFNHPYDGSFCHAILSAALEGSAEGGHHCRVIDLDKDGFDPAMRAKDLRAFMKIGRDGASALELLDPLVLEYKKKLEWAEHLAFIFPVWWMTMPAMTKGFIDKVIFPGIAYNMKDGELVCRLDSLEKVTIISTMNTPADVYKEQFGNAIESTLVKGTFNKIGIRDVDWFSFNKVKQTSLEQRQEWLELVKDIFC